MADVDLTASGGPVASGGPTAGAREAGRFDGADVVGEVAAAVGQFLEAVATACRSGSLAVAVPLLHLELARLVFAGGRLGALVTVVPRDRFEVDAGPEPDPDTLREDLARLLARVDDYTEVFDPCADEVEIVTSRLSDDLAVVIADLTHGMRHFTQGRSTEALWWWQYSYLSNWGSTATAALRALQSHVTRMRLEPELDPDTAAEQQLLADLSARATGAA